MPTRSATAVPISAILPPAAPRYQSLAIVRPAPDGGKGPSAPRSGGGVPRSHGPPAEKVNAKAVNGGLTRLRRVNETEPWRRRRPLWRQPAPWCLRSRPRGRDGPSDRQVSGPRRAGHSPTARADPVTLAPSPPPSRHSLAAAASIDGASGPAIFGDRPRRHRPRSRTPAPVDPASGVQSLIPPRSVGR